MSIRFVDGFDNYNTTIMRAQLSGGPFKLRQTSLPGGGNNIGTSSPTPPYSNGSWCEVDGSNLMYCQLDQQAQWLYGFHFNRMASGATEFFRFYNGPTLATLGARFYYDASGFIVIRNSANTVLVTATTNSMLNTTWYYIEIKLALNSSTGTMEVRVNGNVAATYTGNTVSANASLSTLDTGVFVGNSAQMFDNLLVKDDTTYLGERRIVSILPTAAGTYTGLTAHSGTNWGSVSDVTEDADTTYVSGSSGQDSYNLADWTLSGTIDAVCVNMVARKDDTATRSVAPLLRSASTDNTGTAQQVTANYQNFNQIYTLNPVSGSAWTGSDITSLEAGVVVT